ncbi:MAG: CPBP family intramembrane glutamic endopeptidase [Dehalococcoidia bacterium]|jgi:membrane protease YdiL (CAAX protease family)
MKLNLTAISRWEPLPFWLYLVAITATETLTIFLYPLVGIIAYSLILITFIIQSVFIEDPVKRNLVLALSLVPLVRILSLAMPLGQLSLVYRFPLIYTPLLAATITVMWVTGLKPSTVGLNLRYWPYQVAGGLITGIGIGITEYLIIGTSPLINRLTFQEFWLPALILLFTTGLVEELIFRGILQHLAETMMGRQGIVYVSLIFAVLHFGFFSWGDVVFVFFVALFFAATVKRTGSLLGAILSHGVANIVLFLVAPFVLS